MAKNQNAQDAGSGSPDQRDLTKIIVTEAVEASALLDNLKIPADADGAPLTLAKRIELAIDTVTSGETVLALPPHQTDALMQMLELQASEQRLLIDTCTKRVQAAREQLEVEEQALERAATTAAAIEAFTALNKFEQ